ncbi:hypothetical protein [Anditalea andensis]|nr:hypothetical protein [Anditalea andensis]
MQPSLGYGALSGLGSGIAVFSDGMNRSLVYGALSGLGIDGYDF